MPVILVWILLGLCGFTVAVFAAAVIATAVHVRREADPAIEFPPVSLVKPMKGVDESLAANLESFFALRYPAAFELVFAYADANDPAVGVAREAAARYPHIPVRFVLSDATAGLNPKVANLIAALPAAQYDLIFQTDANVRVAPNHLADVVAEFMAQKAGLLSSMIVGSGERSLGAALENLHLTTVIAPSVAFASRVGRQAVVVGKALLYRNSELRALGGIGQFKDVLAEDYLMGACYARAGRRVVLSAYPIQNVNEHGSIKGFLARHSRWLKMNAVINPAAFLLRGIISPLWAAPLLILGWGDPLAEWIGLGTLVVFLAGQQALFRALRREWMSPRLMLLSFLDAVLMWAVWPYSAISRSVNWRGEKLIVGKRTRLARH